MIKCPECRAENQENAEFCQECGSKLKKENQEKISFKSLDFKAILIGSIIAIPGILIFIIGSGLVAGLIAGFLAGKSRKIGAIHGAIASIGAALLITSFFNSPSTDGFLTILTFIMFLIFGMLGGFLGSYAYTRKNDNMHSDKDKLSNNRLNTKWGLAFLVFLLIIIPTSYMLYFSNNVTFLELNEPDKVANEPKKNYGVGVFSITPSTNLVTVKGKTEPNAQLNAYELKTESGKYPTTDDIKSSGKPINVIMDNNTGIFEFNVNPNLNTENEETHVFIEAKSTGKENHKITLMISFKKSSSRDSSNSVNTAYTGQSDKAINLVQNYKDPNGFTVANNVIAMVNTQDYATGRTHKALWSAKQTNNEYYEVTCMITPDEWKGSGGGTAKWKVNVATGTITALDENAKAYMQGIS